MRSRVRGSISNYNKRHSINPTQSQGRYFTTIERIGIEISRDGASRVTASAVTPDIEKRARQLQQDVLTWRPLSDVSDVRERSLLSANMTGATRAIRFKKLPPASNNTEVILGLVKALVEKHSGLFSELKVKAMATLLRWRGVTITGRLLDTRKPEFAKIWDSAKPSDAALRRAMSTGESTAPMEVDVAPESKCDAEDEENEDDGDDDDDDCEDVHEHEDSDNGGSQPTAQQLAMIGRTFCDREDCDLEKLIVHSVKLCKSLGTIAAFYGSYGESIASDAQLERLPVDDLMNADWVEWCDGNDGEGGADGDNGDNDCRNADDVGATGGAAGSVGDNADGVSTDDVFAYDNDGPTDGDLESMMASMEQAGTVGIGDGHADDHALGSTNRDAASSESDEEDDIPIGELFDTVTVNFDGCSEVHPSRNTIDSKQPTNDRRFFNQVGISFRRTGFVLGRFGPHMSLCPIIEEEDDSRWIVRVEDIFTDDDGDELFYMSYFFSESQLRGDKARQTPKLAKNELVESVNVFPAALGDIVGFVHVVLDPALANGPNRTRGGLPVHYANRTMVYNLHTKRLVMTNDSGLRVQDFVRMGT